MTKNEKSGGGNHIAPKSKYNEVVKFFPVSVDNFFDNPDKIVKYAKNLPKEPDPIGKWPGNRSETIWKINKELNDLIILKILSCYYDLSYQDISWDYADLYFHEIPTIFKDKNDVRNKGEIHVDANDAPYEIAGLIYLTPDIDSDLGTSLFTLKQRNDKITERLYNNNINNINTDHIDVINNFDNNIGLRPILLSILLIISI